MSVASRAASSQRRDRRPDILFRALLWVGALGVATIKRGPFVCDGRARVRSGCRTDGSYDWAMTEGADEQQPQRRSYMTDVTVVVDRPALFRWRRAIMAAFGLGGITVAAWGPRLPAVKAELGIGIGTIGLLLAGVTVGAIAGLVASTPILHWLGSRGGVTASLLVVAAAMAVMGVAITLRSVPLVSFAFLVIGFGIGTLDVLINVEGSAIERAAGRTLMPLMHGAWSIGAAVGSGIGAACAALGVTPSVQFIGEAVIIGVVALAMAPAIPTGTRTQDAPPTETRLANVRQWLRGWTDWRLLLIGVVLLGVELGEAGVPQLVGKSTPLRVPDKGRCFPKRSRT